MPAHSVAVLSDIHIGNDANTCWYQSTVHEPYLVAALDWVAQNAGMYQEVVLLGDLVDTWTYAPSVQPPSMADIVAANPNVLGPGGALARVVAAIPRVSFLLGNHDGTLTDADITTLQDAVGPIALVDPVHVLTGTTGARTVFSHGHHWAMFNAPDDMSPWGTLPVGHFVTRAFSYMMANSLQPGETVADRANMGYPNGWDLRQFVHSLGPDMSPDLAALLLDYVATVANMSKSLPIVLPNGATTTIADAKQSYADLFTRWVAKESGSVNNAARAALADGAGEYLAWFAQRLAIEQGADLVVLGHTHTPIGGLMVSPINYCNSGFECASIPDNPPHEFTFTVVDLDTATAEVMKVNHGDYMVSVAGVDALPSVVLSPAMDFSCYVRIINETAEPLELAKVSATDGHWVVPPPDSIPPGGRGDAWLQDYVGPNGSDGAFTYTRGGAPVPFSVSCPTGLGLNTASGAGNNFVARSGSGDWGATGRVPLAGHPLQVIFHEGGPVIPQAWTPTSALAHAVFHAGFMYDPDQDIIYSRMDAWQRSFGYAYGYDVGSLGIDFILDCEPIFFDYDGKHWMIELWKGQYGVETGCEIGVYTRAIGSEGGQYDLLDKTVGWRPGDDVRSHNLFYECASDADRLELSATLKRNGEVVFTRGPELHWWLTGFKWGVLSDPSELSMDVAVTLKDDAMRDAFLMGIDGRPYKNLTVDGNKVSFTFDQTGAVPQPPMPAPIRAGVRAVQEQIVGAYNALGFPNNDPNQIEAEFLDVLGLGMLRLVDQFGLAVSRLAIEIGEEMAAVVAGLVSGFGVAVSTIEAWLAGAGQTFSGWVGAVEDYLGLPLDFACYVEIDNTEGTSDLLLAGSTADLGAYAVGPPDWIARGTVARLVLKDPKPSLDGSKGSATYRYCDADLEMKSVTFTYECPTVEDNQAASSDAEWATFAKSNTRDMWSPSVPGRGHPLYVSYVLGGGEPASGTRKVTRTRKSAEGDITHLCGGPDVRWGPVPVADAIAQIRSGNVSYITSANGSEAAIHVIEDSSGAYLRTTPDKTPANNLDELPDC